MICTEQRAYRRYISLSLVESVAFLWILSGDFQNFRENLERGANIGTLARAVAVAADLDLGELGDGDDGDDGVKGDARNIKLENCDLKRSNWPKYGQNRSDKSQKRSFWLESEGLLTTLAQFERFLLPT